MGDEYVTGRVFSDRADLTVFVDLIVDSFYAFDFRQMLQYNVSSHFVYRIKRFTANGWRYEVSLPDKWRGYYHQETIEEAYKHWLNNLIMGDDDDATRR
jgi:hypothetical protein